MRSKLRLMEEERKALKEKAIEALKKVYDPEIPINVYDLGLVYGVEVDDEGNVEVNMTLTAPGCPIAGMVVAMTKSALKEELGEGKVKVNLVWDPPWTPERITEEGRKRLKEVYGYDVVSEWVKRSKGE